MSNSIWYKVDNVSKVFLASYTRRDSRSFRVSCMLNENVDANILEKALKLAVKQRPQYQVIIHKGLFWHYMEKTDKTVKVKEENKRPCPYLYGPGREGKLHYSVTYFKNRINLDMFHVLSDGNGGFEFIDIIVRNYLKLKYPEELGNITIGTGASTDDLEQNSYKQFFGNNAKSEQEIKNAYHIRGLKLPYDQLQFFEVHFSAQAVIEQAKKMKVSLTSYIGARLMLAIYKDMPVLQRNKPINLSMPVNLRNYYQSSTSRNFFNSVFVSRIMNGEETLQELAQWFDNELKQLITPENVATRMDSYEKLEHLFLVKLVPLFIKNPVVAFFAKKENKKVSAVISNLGRLMVDEQLKSYIKGYSFFCSTNALFMTINSYGDDLTLGISSAYRNTSVLKNFIRGFTSEGIEATIYATDVV